MSVGAAWHVVAALVLATSLVGCADAEPAATGAGRFTVEHADAPKGLRSTATWVAKKQVVEQAADLVERRVALPEDIAIVVRSCTTGTGYLPEERLIEICLQDVQQTRALLEDAEAEDLKATERGILTETVTHEAAHAVIDVLGLRYTGREEDVADQFSAYVLAESGDEGLDVLESAAYGYEISASAYEAEDADEHSSDAQRAINLQCWVLGADERDADHLVSPDGLTRERADRCGEEWSDLEEGWSFLLQEAGALRS